MGLVVVTSARTEAELIEKASRSPDLEIVNTGNEFWPKAIRARVEVRMEDNGSQVAFKPQAYIEGNCLHFWGVNLKNLAFEGIFRPLRERGVYEVDKEACPNCESALTGGKPDADLSKCVVCKGTGGNVSEPVGLNEEEHALLRAEAARKKASARWDAKIQAMRAAITKTCRHAQTQDFKWEHDTGFGVQIKHVGLRCVFCLKVNRWPKVGPQRWDKEYFDE